MNNQYIIHNDFVLPIEIDSYIIVMHKLLIENKNNFRIFNEFFIPLELALGKISVGQDISRRTPASVGGQQDIRSKNGGQ